MCLQRNLGDGYVSALVDSIRDDSRVQHSWCDRFNDQSRAVAHAEVGAQIANEHDDRTHLKGEQQLGVVES